MRRFSIICDFFLCPSFLTRNSNEFLVKDTGRHWVDELLIVIAYHTIVSSNMLRLRAFLESDDDADSCISLVHARRSNFGHIQGTSVDY